MAQEGFRHKFTFIFIAEVAKESIFGWKASTGSLRINSPCRMKLPITML